MRDRNSHKKCQYRGMSTTKHGLEGQKRASPSSLVQVTNGKTAFSYSEIV